MARLTMVPQQAAQQPAVVSGNFSKCSSRFDGTKEMDVNTFIDAVLIFKEYTWVSDDIALKGLPMLLDGFAATWFRGVKGSNLRMLWTF